MLISRHRDGEFNAIAAERLGIETIRGSGDHNGEFHRKGGVGAFREMLEALAEGYNVALTADVPKVSRVAGLGIIMLARIPAGRSMPFAMVTSRCIELNNWDRTTINLPFGRVAVVAIEADLCAARRRRRDAGSRAPAGRERTEPGDRARLCHRRPEGERFRRERHAAVTLARLSDAVVGGGAAGAAAADAAAASAARRLRARIGERRGVSRHRAAAGPLVWMHGASVGELAAAAADRAHARARRPRAPDLRHGDLGGARRTAVAAPTSSINSCRSMRRAMCAAFSITGGPIWRCSSNPICGRT